MNYSELVFVVLILSLIIQAIYLGYFTSRLSFNKDNKPFISKSVSVIICAKNEAENLKKIADNIPNLIIILSSTWRLTENNRKIVDRSLDSIDLDTQIDWDFAELMIKQNQIEID